MTVKELSLVGSQTIDKRYPEDVPMYIMLDGYKYGCVGFHVEREPDEEAPNDYRAYLYLMDGVELNYKLWRNIIETFSQHIILSLDAYSGEVPVYVCMEDGTATQASCIDFALYQNEWYLLLKTRRYKGDLFQSIIGDRRDQSNG